MNNSIIVAVLLILSAKTQAIGIDDSRCQAAKSIARKLVQTYISGDLQCLRDEDCHEIFPLGGHACGARLVTKVGLEGFDILKGSVEYQRLGKIVEKEDKAGACGPAIQCDRRPEEVKCLAGLCGYQKLK